MDTKQALQYVLYDYPDGRRTEAAQHLIDKIVTAETTPGGVVGITQIVSLTQAQYDALVTKDPAVLYVIVEG